VEASNNHSNHRRYQKLYGGRRLTTFGGTRGGEAPLKSASSKEAEAHNPAYSKGV
jgi:hypothetical protein